MGQNTRQTPITVKPLSAILANTYALYLKTQNYHWHVYGPQFKELHELFEAQYRELIEAIDEIAERIRILGSHAPATFNEYNALKTLTDGDSNTNAKQMLDDLYHDNQTLVSDLKGALLKAAEINDEGTVVLLSNRITSHEKSAWMLDASRTE